MNTTSILDCPQFICNRAFIAMVELYKVSFFLPELLPGIEEFLVRILPQEKLSRGAEERRQYFVERLDILKLPPSLPPRAGKMGK